MHKIEMSPEVLDRVKGFREGFHMFSNIDPLRTAHIIVDLQNGFMEPGATVELPVARDIVDDPEMADEMHDCFGDAARGEHERLHSRGCGTG